jgi:plasmid stabilization system protein ParE
MTKLRSLSPAEEEIAEAASFYENVSDGLGSEFLNDVQRVGEVLRRYPAIGTPSRRGLRFVRLSRFPFNIFYHFAEDTDEVVVVAVAHEKRKPDYWRERLSDN